MHVSDLIFDVGMNRGMDAAYYLAKGFRVVGVEADPIVAAEVSDRLANPRLVVEAVGIGPEHGSVLPFYVNLANNEQSTFLKGFTTQPNWSRGFVVKEVPVTTLDRLIDKHGCPYYCKIDIEAWDLLALVQLQPTGHRPPFISVETGPDLDWINKLEELGYTRLQLRNQELNERQKLAADDGQQREGKAIYWQFECGCSGIFGRDISAQWRTPEDLRRDWQAHIDKGFPEGNWFDVHGWHETAAPSERPPNMLTGVWRRWTGHRAR